MEKFIISSIAWAWLFTHVVSFLGIVFSLVAFILGVHYGWIMLLTFFVVRGLLEFTDYRIKKETGFNGLTDWLKNKTN